MGPEQPNPIVSLGENKNFFRSLFKPIVNPNPKGLPPVGAILMITDDLKFIVKSHLRRNRIIIQRLPEPKKGKENHGTQRQN